MNTEKSTPLSTWAEKREFLQHVVQAWGFLVPRGARLTFTELAGAIRRYSAHPRAEAIATSLTSLQGHVNHDWRGFQATW